MGDISKIVEGIKKMASKGELNGEKIVRVINLPENKMILLEASFAGDRDYKIMGDVLIDAEKDCKDKKYNVYIKYVGVKNEK